jgi:methyl-accepting chemotaxis protein
VETGEIFKFTAIPRSNNRGIIESALDAGAIEINLQHYIESNNSIRSMNLFDFTLLTLTSNYDRGKGSIYTKGNFVAPGTTPIDAFFAGSTGINISLDKQNAQIYYPIIDNGRVRYVLFIDLDASGYYKLEQLIGESIATLVRDSTYLNTTSMIVVFAALVIFTAFIAFMISRLLQPLGFMDTMLASFSRGNFALTVPENFTKRKDEMGEISVSFVNTLEEMKHLV